MKVLFVYRVYGLNHTNSVVDAQRKSLEKRGVEIEVFTLKKGGIGGYFKAYLDLRKFLKVKQYDIVHAHYSLSGFLVALTTNNRIICSLMGSDLLRSGNISKSLINLMARFRWRATIVKSEEMGKLLSKAYIIPNGVDLTLFKKMDRKMCCEIKTEFDPEKKNIIFVAENPESDVKNIELAKKAYDLLNKDIYSFHVISGKKHNELPYYYNAADVLLLTSKSEGSPNVIKEALACGLSIVSTDVGEVGAIIKNIKGCLLCSFDEKDVSEKIKSAVNFKERMDTKKIIEKYDDKIIANRIISLYKEVLDI